MSKMYFLENDVKFDERLVYASGMRMETRLCPLDAGQPSQHAMRQRWVRPLKVIGPVGRMTEFEWSVYGDILLEKDIADKLRMAGFSGVEFHPAELYTTTETPIGRHLYELRVTGWGGMAHPSSGIQIQEKCSFCGRSVYSGHTNAANLFDIDKWDGSNFFLIWPMPRYVFIASEVANFILKQGWSGVRIKELDKFPKSIAGSYTPGHVEDWFDEVSAAKIVREF